jgi:hypothetical protein
MWLSMNDQVVVGVVVIYIYIGGFWLFFPMGFFLC